MLVRILKMYQKYVSPQCGANCRFIPSCSTYAIEAINKYGAVQGTILTVKRLMRCHPFGKYGYDPVP